MKTLELTGTALDWAVAKCEGFTPHAAASIVIMESYRPSTDWAQAGQIIEREGIDIHQIKTRPYALYENSQRNRERFPDGEAVKWGATIRWRVPNPPAKNEGKWLASMAVDSHPFGWKTSDFLSSTPLVAAMRCYVASKLGDDVEIPEELK